MKRVLLSILLTFVNLSVSVLLYNYLVMGRGYIWHELFGAPLWDYTWEWNNYAVPLGLTFSAIVAAAISLIDGWVCRRYFPKLLREVVFFLLYAAGWMYISFLLSESYIYNFGNTWTDTEIFREMVFVFPFFTLVWIAVGGVFLILSKYR